MFSVLVSSTSGKTRESLDEKGGSSVGLVLEVWRQLTNSLVVTSDTMNTGFNQNQAKLAVHILHEIEELDICSRHDDEVGTRMRIVERKIFLYMYIRHQAMSYND